MALFESARKKQRIYLPLKTRVNPLKLMEYFALGLPVLATRLPELEHIEGPLHLAETREDFGKGLQALLNGRWEGQAEHARRVARRNTWNAPRRCATRESGWTRCCRIATRSVLEPPEIARR